MSAAVIAGVTCEGIEWDWEMVVDRSILWAAPIGSTPRPVELWLTTAAPQVLDMVDATFSVWMPWATASALEASLPPYVEGWKFDLSLPWETGNLATPGFGKGSDSAWNIVNCTMNSPVESMGRKAPLVDLFGYQFSIHFAASGGGSALNETGSVPPLLPTIPEILSHKFIAHQLNDASRSEKPLPVSPAYTGAQHGRRVDSAMMLDHLTSAEAAAVVAWFRGQRGIPFSLTTSAPFGPVGLPGVTTASAVAIALSVKRGAGWWWDLQLDLCKA